VYGPWTIRILRGQQIAILHETLTDLDGSHFYREKGLPTQSTPRRLIDPWSVPNFSSEPINEAVGISQAPVGDQLLGLLDP
jgi:hypothetical protein